MVFKIRFNVNSETDGRPVYDRHIKKGRNTHKYQRKNFGSDGFDWELDIFEEIEDKLAVIRNMVDYWSTIRRSSMMRVKQMKKSLSEAKAE